MRLLFFFGRRWRIYHIFLVYYREVSGVELTERRVERGARLVHVISEDTRVILSLPRGNIECIQPRGLTLDVLIQSLERQHFRETFELARKQRINLNIIVDHNPSTFFENVHNFVAKINEPDWLSLFLSELRDEDVTTTMYGAHYKQPRPVVLQDKASWPTVLNSRTLFLKDG